MEDKQDAVGVVLMRAAELLEQDGAWIQGQYALDAGGDNPDDAPSYLIYQPVCFCAIGAINRAAGFAVDQISGNPALDYFGDFLGVESIHTWNDAPERDQAQVVSTLRAAAAATRLTDAP